jgi:hypothetical protein
MTLQQQQKSVVEVFKSGLSRELSVPELWNFSAAAFGTKRPAGTA